MKKVLFDGACGKPGFMGFPRFVAGTDSTARDDQRFLGFPLVVTGIFVAQANHVGQLPWPVRGSLRRPDSLAGDGHGIGWFGELLNCLRKSKQIMSDNY